MTTTTIDGVQFKVKRLPVAHGQGKPLDQSDQGRIYPRSHPWGRCRQQGNQHDH